MSKVRGSSWMRLISAVLVALMGVGTVGMGTASSQGSNDPGNAVLYPLIVKDDPRVVTLATYMGPNFPSDAVVDPVTGVANNALHYQYHSKLQAPAGAADGACLAGSVEGDTSLNDVLTYDTSGFFGTQPLFNDTTSSGASGLSLITAGPSFAYLVINATVQGEFNGPNFGEAQIIDLANGGMWGYNAVSIPSGSNGTGIGGGVALLSGTRRPVHLYPPTVATTAFAVTPTGTDMIGNSANRARVQLQLSEGLNHGGVYDRNENPIDFTSFAQTQCVWIFPLPALVAIQAITNPIWRAEGGWAWLSNNPTLATPTPAFNGNAIVFKIISAGAAGSFVLDGQPVFTGLCGFDTGVSNGETIGGCE